MSKTIIKHEISKKTGKDYFCLAIRKTKHNGEFYDIAVSFDTSLILKLTDFLTLAGLDVGGYIEI